MLCLIAALDLEARPLIAHYKLQSIIGHPYRLYASDNMRLIISGVGKIAAAAAVAYQQALLGNTAAAWLNIGIAGHRSRAVGSALLAHKIADIANGKTFYPAFTDKPPCDTDLLHTVEQPETIYATDCAYDMEASGFYETALRFASAELVHCLKVVSDNASCPVERFDIKKATGLIETHLNLLDQFVASLQELSWQMTELQADPPSYLELSERWHFTTTQRHQLRGLLQRWQTLLPTQDIINDDLLSLQQGNEILRYLEQQMLNADLTLT